jgi:hypothetical protein
MDDIDIIRFKEPKRLERHCRILWPRREAARFEFSILSAARWPTTRA